MEQPGTIWNNVEQPGTMWNNPEQNQNIPEQYEQHETTWNTVSGNYAVSTGGY